MGSYVGGDDGSTSGTDLLLTWPAVDADDQALLWWTGQSDFTFTDPTGFALVRAFTANSGTHESRLYRKTCVGDEDAGSISLQMSSANKHSATLLVYRGYLGINGHAVIDEDSGTGTHACPPLTPSVADCAIVVACSERLSSGTESFTPPATYTKREEITSQGGGGATFLSTADDGLGVSRDANVEVNPGSFTGGDATANTVTWTVALTPASQDDEPVVSDSAEFTDDVTALDAATAATDGAAVTESAVLGTSNVRYSIAVDWAGDGDFSDDGDDVTRRTLERGSFTAEFGRDQTRALSPTASGRASLEIDNRSRDYSPDNAESPLYGSILPARPLRIQAQQEGVTHVLFRGHTDDYEIKPARNERSVAVTGLDAVAMLQGAKISTQLYQGIRPDQAIHVVLDAVGWPDTPLNANPFFTTDVTGWVESNTTLSRSTAVVHPDGTASMLITPSGSAGAGGAGSALVDVTAGHAYIASAWVNAPDGYDGLRVHVNWYTTGDVFLETTAGPLVEAPAGVWTRLRAAFAAPATAVKAAVWVWQVSSPAATDLVYAWSAKLTDGNDDPWRRLDPGATVIRWWWAEDEDAFEVVQRLVASEGPPAMLHANEDGGITFRSRHHRLLTAASTSAQATLADTTEPAFSEFTYDHGWRDVINAVSVKVEEYDPSPEPEAVWEDESVRNIGMNETLELRVTLDDPVVSPSLTFTTLAGATTSAIMQDSGQTVTLAIAAGSGGATISHLAVLGQPVTSRRTIDMLATEPSSIQRYGRRDYTHDAPWAGVHDAAAIGDLIIAQRSERRPIVTVRLTSQTRTTSKRLTQQLTRDLSDRIHIYEPETGTDHDFHVEQIKHTAKQAGLQLDTEFGLERAVTQADGVFRFDDDDHGFDDGVFASVGLQDPETLFIFDAEGHGFDDGAFAA